MKNKKEEKKITISSLYKTFKAYSAYKNEREEKTNVKTYLFR